MCRAHRSGAADQWRPRLGRSGETTTEHTEAAEGTPRMSSGPTDAEGNRGRPTNEKRPRMETSLAPGVRSADVNPFPAEANPSPTANHHPDANHAAQAPKGAAVISPAA